MQRRPLIPQNFPFKVEFAGMRGDTLSMQSQGWELAVDQAEDHYHDAMMFRVAGRHPKLKLSLISGEVRLERQFFHQAMMGGNEGAIYDYFQHIHIPISFVAPKIDMVVYGKPNFRSVNFGDFGMRELDVNNIRRFTLDELGVFRSFGNETELFVPEKKIVDVQEFLKDILVSQEDKQREIRQRMLREEEKFNLRNELAEAPKLRLVGY